METEPGRCSLMIPPDLRHLARVREFLRSLLPWGERERLELELATTEALSNVLLHGRRTAPGGDVVLEVSSTAERARVRIVYDGDAFDAVAAGAPRLDTSSDRGFGRYLIEQCVDEVAYRGHEGRCSVELVKRVRVEGRDPRFGTSTRRPPKQG